MAGASESVTSRMTTTQGGHSHGRAGATSRTEDRELPDIPLPATITLYPDTDEEGEPCVWSTRDLWPADDSEEDSGLSSELGFHERGEVSTDPYADEGCGGRFSTNPSKDAEGEPQATKEPQVSEEEGGHPTTVEKDFLPASDPDAADSDGPEYVVVHPDTDQEGELELKFAWQLWPRRRSPKQRRASNCDVRGPPEPCTEPELSSGVDLSAGVQGRVTTLSVQNLPKRTTQQDFLAEVDGSGFAGTYDFAYLPRGRVYAFLNFKNTDIAASFTAAWHGSRRFGVSEGAPALIVEAASVQGFQENATKWVTGEKAAKTAFRPFVAWKPSHNSGCRHGLPGGVASVATLRTELYQGFKDRF